MKHQYYVSPLSLPSKNLTYCPQRPKSRLPGFHVPIERSSFVHNPRISINAKKNIFLSIDRRMRHIALCHLTNATAFFCPLSSINHVHLIFKIYLRLHSLFKRKDNYCDSIALSRNFLPIQFHSSCTPKNPVRKDPCCLEYAV